MRIRWEHWNFSLLWALDGMGSHRLYIKDIIKDNILLCQVSLTQHLMAMCIGAKKSCVKWPDRVVNFLEGIC